MPSDRREEARAALLELYPEGFEEVEADGQLELVAYAPADDHRQRRLEDAFGAVDASTVPEDWANRWRAFHRPVRVGPLWIGPPWEPAPRDGLAVVIEPGRAFGTGAHPTTRLCLALALELPRGSFVDLGCGSGVLALAAAKLGFAPVSALDADPAAVEATAANAVRNGVEVDVRLGDVVADPPPAADVVVVNIGSAAVERVAAQATCRHLIGSGYLASEQPSFDGFQPLRRLEADGWAADLVHRV